MSAVNITLLEPQNISFQCHSGVMGGGHYVSYCKTAAAKWWCQNDSTCKVSIRQRYINLTCQMIILLFTVLTNGHKIYHPRK